MAGRIAPNGMRFAKPNLSLVPTQHHGRAHAVAAPHPHLAVDATGGQVRPVGTESHGEPGSASAPTMRITSGELDKGESI